MLDSAGAEFAKKRRPARNGTSCEGVKVRIGILSSETSTSILRGCTSLLKAGNGTGAGAESKWEGPWCCEISNWGLTVGKRYYLAVDADVTDEVAETTGKNNLKSFGYLTFEDTKPDLVPTGAKLTAWGFDVKHQKTYLCLNMNANTGKKFWTGAYVKVKNIGQISSKPYKVRVGIAYSPTSTSMHRACSSLLTSHSGTGAGKESTWLGPWCCHFSNWGLSSGHRYHLAIQADATGTVSEKNGKNNLKLFGYWTFNH